LPAGNLAVYDARMMWLFFVLVLLIPLFAVVLDSQLGRALARRLEEGEGVSHERLAALESEVERLGREVELLREQTEFVDRLLQEKKPRELPGSDGV
jgi:cell division protein FtsB